MDDSGAAGGPAHALRLRAAEQGGALATPTRHDSRFGLVFIRATGRTADGGEGRRRDWQSLAGERGGDPLIVVGGKLAAALRGKELRLAIDVHEWGKGLHSLPIFFANVVDVARAEASGFGVVRTGRPFLLPPGWALQQAPEGAKASWSA